MLNQLLVGLQITLFFTVLTGLIYPGVVSGLCLVLFPSQAHGSLIVRGGKVVGSRLIGQNFSRPEYFQPRPSAAGAEGYDASASGGSNLGPASQKLIDRVKASARKARVENPVPADLVTASGSGLDPHLSPAAALYQVARVAKARGLTPEQVQQWVKEHIEGRDLGFLGEPRVNVLELNLLLDEKAPFRN